MAPVEELYVAAVRLLPFTHSAYGSAPSSTSSFLSPASYELLLLHSTSTTNTDSTASTAADYQGGHKKKMYGAASGIAGGHYYASKPKPLLPGEEEVSEMDTTLSGWPYGHSLLALPTYRCSEEDIAAASLQYVQCCLGLCAIKALPVPLCETPRSRSHLLLVSVRGAKSRKNVREANDDPDELPSGLGFFNLSAVLNAALNEDVGLEAHSRHLIARLEDWISKRQQSNVEFIPRLFFPTPTYERLKRCVLNPAYFGPQSVVTNTTDGHDDNSGELEVAVKNRNLIIAKMLEADKYDKYLLNPLFGNGLGSTLNKPGLLLTYYARDRLPLEKIKAKERSPTELWGQQFPIHKAAFEGNHQQVRELLARGYDPNEHDNDFWTPLHYSVFYNRFKVCELLMLHPKMDVNVPNKTGSTPLHFAALNGHLFLVELILSHQLVDVNVKDSEGRTPLNLCERVAKPDWQDAAFLLRGHLRPSKIEVQMIGGPALQVEVASADTITAKELKDEVIMQEGLGEAAGKIFAIWITNSRLSLQLKAEQNVKAQLRKWPQHLEKWGDPADIGGNLTIIRTAERLQEDRVRIVLRRDARTLLGDEQLIARKNPEIIALLYAEAERNFLEGLYPCSEKCYIQLAAIILQRLYGGSGGNGSLVVDSSMLANVLPRHLRHSLHESSAFTTLVRMLSAAHRNLPTSNFVQLQLLFLRLCWALNVYGSTFFKALMLMAKPIRGNVHVLVGINDWGMSLLNAQTRKQISALRLKELEISYTQNTNYVKVTSKRSKDFSATLTTPQAMLINNLLKQLKDKMLSSNHTVRSTT